MGQVGVDLRNSGMAACVGMVVNEFEGSSSTIVGWENSNLLIGFDASHGNGREACEGCRKMDADIQSLNSTEVGEFGALTFQ